MCHWIIPGNKLWRILLAGKMDFDSHYFFDYLDTEEDFYKSTAPSEDIWKKFELLPTPPMSPTRTLYPLSPGDRLSVFSKMLGQEDECEGQFIPDTEELFGNLSSHIIQDCMWSSFSASKQLEKVNGRTPAAGHTGVSPVPQISARANKAQCVSPGSLLSIKATDCVDPAAVLTFPASSCRKPASSGSESRSDSSGKDTAMPLICPTLPCSRIKLHITVRNLESGGCGCIAVV